MGEESREKTSYPQTKEVDAPRSQEPEETILALGAVPPSGDVDLGGASRPRQTEGRHAEMALSTVPPARPHGNGLAQPEAPTREGGDVTPWGKALVIWPDLEDPEGRARFVLDDPSEAYLWQGLEECGRANVKAINRVRARELRHVQACLGKITSPFSEAYFIYIFPLILCVVLYLVGAQGSGRSALGLRPRLRKLGKRSPLWRRGLATLSWNLKSGTLPPRDTRAKSHRWRPCSPRGTLPLNRPGTNLLRLKARCLFGRGV